MVKVVSCRKTKDKFTAREPDKRRDYLGVSTLRWPVIFKLQHASSALRGKASTAAPALPANVQHVPDKYTDKFPT